MSCYRLLLQIALAKDSITGVDVRFDNPLDWIPVKEESADDDADVEKAAADKDSKDTKETEAKAAKVASG